MAKDVFINCPFDNKYAKKFRCTVFTVAYCGFEPRCAREVSDASQNRLEKILGIIHDCQFAIHDISRTQLDKSHRLPRFNMPFELGLFFGAKEFGGKIHSKKTCLVLDSESYRYQKFLSDIAGQDIQAHRNDIAELILVIRNWLSQHQNAVLLPGYDPIATDFEKFSRAFPGICEKAGMTSNRIPYNDFVNMMKIWIGKKGIMI